MAVTLFWQQIKEQKAIVKKEEEAKGSSKKQEKEKAETSKNMGK